MERFLRLGFSSCADARARRFHMRKIEAIISPSELDALQEALRHVGVKGMTVLEVRAADASKGGKRFYRGSEYSVDFLPKIKVELLVADTDAAAVTTVIERSTESSDTGTILVSSIEDVVRIRTGERGAGAI
jgi:nitrogen regulatory protein P-II 1